MSAIKKEIVDLCDQRNGTLLESANGQKSNAVKRKQVPGKDVPGTSNDGSQKTIETPKEHGAPDIKKKKKKNRKKNNNGSSAATSGNATQSTQLNLSSIASPSLKNEANSKLEEAKLKLKMQRKTLKELRELLRVTNEQELELLRNMPFMEVQVKRLKELGQLRRVTEEQEKELLRTMTIMGTKVKILKAEEMKAKNTVGEREVFPRYPAIRVAAFARDPDPDSTTSPNDIPQISVVKEEPAHHTDPVFSQNVNFAHPQSVPKAFRVPGPSGQMF